MGSACVWEKESGDGEAERKDRKGRGKDAWIFFFVLPLFNSYSSSHSYFHSSLHVFFFISTTPTTSIFLLPKFTPTSPSFLLPPPPPPAPRFLRPSSSSHPPHSSFPRLPTLFPPSSRVNTGTGQIGIPLNKVWRGTLAASGMALTRLEGGRERGRGRAG